MYYAEKIIDGVLCHRSMPHGDWIPFTPEELTAKIETMKAHITAALEKVRLL